MHLEIGAFFISYTKHQNNTALRELIPYSKILILNPNS